jgi:hypothetical protein
MDGRHALRIKIFDRKLEKIFIVIRKAVQVFWEIGDWIGKYLALLIFPGEIWNRRIIQFLFQCPHQVKHWFFRGISFHHKVHLGVPNELIMKIGRRIAAKDDGNMGMIFFANRRNFQASLGMDQPVQIDTESDGVQRSNHFFRIKCGIAQHPIGQIDDANANPIALQMFGQRRKPNRIHLKNRCGRHHVADRSQKIWTLAKIIYCWCME